MSPTQTPHVCRPDDITMVICPGIGNHSEKNYIRTFVDHSQRLGYRCAVLNHLGALPGVELTSPRMFTYGNQRHVTERVCGVCVKSQITELTSTLSPARLYKLWF